MCAVESHRETDRFTLSMHANSTGAASVGMQRLCYPSSCCSLPCWTSMLSCVLVSAFTETCKSKLKRKEEQKKDSWSHKTEKQTTQM